MISNVQERGEREREDNLRIVVSGTTSNGFYQISFERDRIVKEENGKEGEGAACMLDGFFPPPRFAIPSYFEAPREGQGGIKLFHRGGEG